MELGVFSRTYHRSGANDVFEQIARDGFQTVQFNFSTAGLSSLPKEWPDAAIKEVMAAANRHGLSICAISGTYNMAHPDAARRQSERAGFSNVVHAARVMDVPIVTLCTGTRDTANMWSAHPDNGSAEAWSALRGELDFALELAEHHGVALGVEPEPGNVVTDAQRARRLLDEARSPRLKIVLDAANLLPVEKRGRQREVVAEAVALLGPDIALVHTKDVGPNGEAVAAGRGVVDFSLFLESILATGYRGPLVSHNFPEEEAPQVSAYLNSVLDDLRS